MPASDCKRRWDDGSNEGLEWPLDDSQPKIFKVDGMCPFIYHPSKLEKKHIKMAELWTWSVFFFELLTSMSNSYTSDAVGVFFGVMYISSGGYYSIFLPLIFPTCGAVFRWRYPRPGWYWMEVAEHSDGHTLQRSVPHWNWAVKEMAFGDCQEVQCGYSGGWWGFLKFTKSTFLRGSIACVGARNPRYVTVDLGGSHNSLRPGIFRWTNELSFRGVYVVVFFFKPF